MTPRPALSLKVKTALIIGSVLFALLACILLLLWISLTHSVADLQSDRARQQLQRVVTQLDQRAETMLANVNDSALWDETYAFVLGDRPNYLETNFYESPEIIADFDVVAVWDRDGKFLQSGFIAENQFHLGLPDGLAPADLKPTAVLKKSDRSVGLLRTTAGPMIFASHGIHPTDSSGDAAGTLTYAYFLRGRLLMRAALVSGVIELTVAEELASPQDNTRSIALRSDLLPSSSATFAALGSGWQGGPSQMAKISIPSVNGSPVELAADLSNDLFDRAVASRRIIFLFALLGGIVLILTSLTLMDRLVLRRITTLSSEMSRVAGSANSSTLSQIRISGNDEFAALAYSANQMLAALHAQGSALQSERALLESVLNSTTESFIAARLSRDEANLGPELVIVRTNAAALEFLGLSAAAVHDQPLKSLFPEIAAPDISHELLDVANSGPPFAAEFAGIDTRSGQWFRLSACHWAEGLVLTIHNTTDQHNAIEDARRAEEKAAKANDAKSAFLAVMSHEMRTPLNGIIGFADLLRTENLGKTAQGYLHTIEASSQILLTLINDLLDLARIEAGALEITPAIGHFREIVSPTLSTFRALAQTKGIDLAFEIEPSVPEFLELDHSRYRQILMNLVNNALKFTPHGSVSVVIRAIASAEGTFTLETTVADTGIGIDPDDLPRIFSAFRQAHTGVTRRFGGTGLGLTICRDLSRGMGGDIKVESSPNAGSTFRFTVEAHESKPTPVPESASLDSAFPKLQETYPASILIVDDVKTNRLLVGSFLKKLGYEPEFSCDGAEAVEAATSGRFDVIFMDVFMPNLDGYEATRRIREAEARRVDSRRASIIGVSADALAENRQRCLDVGMDDFITKPVHLRDLLDILRESLSRRQTSR